MEVKKFLTLFLIANCLYSSAGIAFCSSIGYGNMFSNDSKTATIKFTFQPKDPKAGSAIVFGGGGGHNSSAYLAPGHTVSVMYHPTNDCVFFDGTIYVVELVNGREIYLPVANIITVRDGNVRPFLTPLTNTVRIEVGTNGRNVHYTGS